MMRLITFWVVPLLCCLVMQPGNATDPRSFQHGIQFLELPGGEVLLLWSSSPGNPPEGAKKVVLRDGEKCEYFNHDIFYSYIDRQAPEIRPKVLVSLPEAQEPVSAAVSENGTITITFEDGSDSKPEKCQGVIQQRYQVYDRQLKPVSDLHTVNMAGAHSGHIATSGNEFLIFYSEGWADNGGVNNAGTGKDIYLDIIHETGWPVYSAPIAVDVNYPRDWWPLIASSRRSSLLAWQRIEQNHGTTSLVYAVFDNQARQLTKAVTKLKPDLQFYHYDVQYLPALKRFLLVGNYIGNVMVELGKREIPAKTTKAFAYLIDDVGNVIDQWESDYCCRGFGFGHSYSFVRESSPAILNNKDETVIVYPVKPRGFLKFKATRTSIAVKSYVKHDHFWFPMGSDGVFLKDKTIYFVNLTPTGLVPVKIDLLEDE